MTFSAQNYILYIMDNNTITLTDILDLANPEPAIEITEPVDMVGLDFSKYNNMSTISSLTTSQIASLSTAQIQPLNLSSLNTCTSINSSGGLSQVSLSGGNSGYITSTIPIGSTNGSSGAVWTTSNSVFASPPFTSPGISGAVECRDVILDGMSLKDTLQEILKRLAILMPNVEKQEKFAALKESYEHHKLLEALIGKDDGENKI